MSPKRTSRVRAAQSTEGGANAAEHHPSKGDHAYDKLLAFPWDPVAIETDPFITHHNADELLGPLGFAAEDQRKDENAPDRPSEAEPGGERTAGGDETDPDSQNRARAMT